MDPVIFEFLGGLLGGALAGLIVVRRAGHSAPEIVPMLAIEKPRPASLVSQRRSSPRSERAPRSVAFTGLSRKARTKTPRAEPELSRISSIPVATTLLFDTCPSCGLQAPGSLLAEHFLGSPSHKNGLPKVVEAETVGTLAFEDCKDDDSAESVRSLLQMLIPPRAFGRRHEHRVMSPISSVVRELGSPRRHYP